MILPIAMAYVGDISPRGEEGKWTGYANAAFFSGYGVGPLLGGVLTDHFGMNAAFFSMGGLCFVAFWVTLILLPDIKERKTTGANGFSFKEMGASRMVRGLFSYRLVQAVGRGCLLTFLPVFAAAAAGLSPTMVGILVSFDLMFTTLLAVPAGRIVDRFDRKAVVITGSVMYLVFLALIPVTNNFWLQMLICIPRGVGGAIATAGASALTVVEGRKFGMGTTTAITMMAMSIGLALGPLISGVIDDFAGINAVFYFGGAAVLLGTAFFTWFTR
jgi:MFS family permease